MASKRRQAKKVISSVEYTGCEKRATNFNQLLFQVRGIEKNIKRGVGGENRWKRCGSIESVGKSCRALHPLRVASKEQEPVKRG